MTRIFVLPAPNFVFIHLLACEISPLFRLKREFAICQQKFAFIYFAQYYTTRQIIEGEHMKRTLRPHSIRYSTLSDLHMEAFFKRKSRLHKCNTSIHCDEHHLSKRSIEYLLFIAYQERKTGISTLSPQGFGTRYFFAHI